MNDGKVTVDVFLDLKKAFDTVNHEICWVNYILIVLEEVLRHGLDHILTWEAKLWTLILLIVKALMLAFHKDLFKNHCCSLFMFIHFPALLLQTLSFMLMTQLFYVLRMILYHFSQSLILIYVELQISWKPNTHFEYSKN